MRHGETAAYHSSDLQLGHGKAQAAFLKAGHSSESPWELLKHANGFSFREEKHNLVPTDGLASQALRGRPNVPAPHRAPPPITQHVWGCWVEESLLFKPSQRTKHLAWGADAVIFWVSEGSQWWNQMRHHNWEPNSDHVFPSQGCFLRVDGECAPVHRDATRTREGTTEPPNHCQCHLSQPHPMQREIGLPCITKEACRNGISTLAICQTIVCQSI